MSSLPPPNPAQTEHAGSLTPSWKIAVIVTHVLIAGSLLVLAISADTVGKPPWWLANRTSGLFSVLSIVPFLAPVGVIMATIRASRFTPIAGLAATALLAATSVVDISRSPGIALGEAILAACTALTTISAFAGRNRSVASGL